MPPTLSWFAVTLSLHMGFWENKVRYAVEAPDRESARLQAMGNAQFWKPYVSSIAVVPLDEVADRGAYLSLGTA